MRFGPERGRVSSSCEPIGLPQVSVKGHLSEVSNGRLVTHLPQDAQSLDAEQIVGYGALPKSEVRTYEVAAAGGITLSVEGVDGAGATFS